MVKLDTHALEHAFASVMKPTPDADLLAALDLSHDQLLGEGGEARVYALDPHRVLRILHPGAAIEGAEARLALLKHGMIR